MTQPLPRKDPLWVDSYSSHFGWPLTRGLTVFTLWCFRGGPWGGVPGCTPPPPPAEMNCSFPIQLVFCKIFCHFHLALVAASISHFVTAVTKFSCCSSNKKNVSFCLFFISRSRSLSPSFSLIFAGLPPTFSFSLCFSCSVFQICGHDN